jgi:large subunit ribosomal protein L29
MKADKLRDLNPDELAAKERELQESLFKLRFQLATGQIDDPVKIRHVRKDLARVKTIRHERAGNKGKNG